MTSTEKIRQIMRERGSATRPELAKAAGVSTVMVGKVISQLMERGEVKESGLVPSGGGRPVMRYEYNAGYGTNVLIEGVMEGVTWRIRIQYLDSQGKVLAEEEARYAHLEPASLDGLLDKGFRKYRIRAVCVDLAGREQKIARHLSERFGIPVRALNAALVLAERKESALTLILQEQQAVLGAYYRRGELRRMGDLSLLPGPADWLSMNYNDHTLLEEMIARLLLVCCCTHSPAELILYAPFWTEKLVKRIRFNLSSKLRGGKASLSFRTLTEGMIAEARHRAAAQL